MLSNDKLIQEAASYKGDAKKRFESALKALLTLAWRYRDEVEGDFKWESNPELYEEALRICRELTDGCEQDARNRLYALIQDTFDYADEDAAWDFIYDFEGETVTTRFDMSGSHLLLLLEVWIAVAFANEYTKDYTRICILRYLNNPFASGLFGAWGKDVLKWGRGYSKNIADQLAVIGQNAIIGGYRYAEQVDAQAKGAMYYIRRRGSTYDCPSCDALCGYPIPIETPFEYLHSRCCCYPEYHYEPLP